MQIIISPAKKMQVEADSLAPTGKPALLYKAEVIYDTLLQLDKASLKSVWKCNDKLLQQNVERLHSFRLSEGQTPAIFAYDGIQYRYMAPNVFTEDELSYVQAHLFMLSGLYGALRPLDAVIPYRLEMQAALSVAGSRNLYDFWGQSIADEVLAAGKTIINLASKEYSQCISKFLPADAKFIDCIFGELKDGKIIEKGTMCKMARGEMVRYLAEQKAKSPDCLCGFDRLDHRFSEKHSSERRYVFLRGGE